jgi:hypothetical protein
MEKISNFIDSLSKKHWTFLLILSMIICIGFITVAVIYDMVSGVVLFSFFLGINFTSLIVMLLRKNGETDKKTTKEVNK